jgi:hypothetical protein
MNIFDMDLDGIRLQVARKHENAGCHRSVTKRTGKTGRAARTRMTGRMGKREGGRGRGIREERETG